MKLIVIAALLMAIQVFAAETKKSESKDLTLPDFSNLQQPAPGSQDGVSFSASMECKTSDGQSFKSGDTGFDGCMAQKGNHK